jgi:four helix bundle suffix protein
MSTPSIASTPSTAPTYLGIAGNGALALIAVACRLLDRPLAAQAEAFRREGGFAERLCRHRLAVPPLLSV